MLTNSEIMAALKKTKAHFFSLDRPTRIKNATLLKQFIESIFKLEKQKLKSINYIFCSDKTILKINRSFLNHDFYTDVITFDLSQDDKYITAEVYISIDRVRENSKNLKVSIRSEFHRVLFHAALHLCGYDDKTKDDIAVIRNKEEELLSMYFNGK